MTINDTAFQYTLSRLSDTVRDLPTLIDTIDGITANEFLSDETLGCLKQLRKALGRDTDRLMHLLCKAEDAAADAAPELVAA